MLTQYERAKLAGSNVSGNSSIRWPGTSAPPGPRVKVRVTVALFNFDGSPVKLGQVIECSVTDAETLVGLRKWAEFVR